MRNAIATIAASLLLATPVLAQEHPEHPKGDAAKADVVEAVVTGKNVCMGCATKKAYGAASQCDKYGHRHALEVTSASAEGANLGYMTGWVLFYLDTDKAQPFIKEHDGETVTLKGKVYPAQRVFEVDKPVDAKKVQPQKSEHPEHPKG